VLVDVAALVAIHGDLAAAAADYRSFARLDGGNITNISGREVIPVLLGDVHVFFHIFGSRAKLDAGRIVELCPLVLSPLYQLVEDYAGDGSVSHSVSRVTGGDVDVLVTARVPADVRHVVHRLHHLPRPVVLYALDHRETLAGPLLETCKTLSHVVRLTGPVILAADDKNLVIELVAGAVLGLLQADVVVGIGRIPVQSVRNRAARNARADDVGAVRGLFAVNDQPVVHRSICADHDVVGADHVPVARRNARRLTVHDFLGVNARINFSSIA